MIIFYEKIIIVFYVNKILNLEAAAGESPSARGPNFIKYVRILLVIIFKMLRWGCQVDFLTITDLAQTWSTRLFRP